ncbi:MAG: glycosyltransferase family 39 protein [Terriglobales bacterium]
MPDSFRCKAALVILIAVVVRCAFVGAVEKGVVKYEFNPDSYDYLSFAHNLATGVGFAHAVNEYEPYSTPVEFSAWRPPLYPAVLAVAFQFSRNTLFLRLLQGAFQVLALYFFLRLGFVLFGEEAALIAGAIFALYPPLLMYSADLGTESLFLLLLMAVLFLLYERGTEHSLPRVVALGVMVGLTALCRPNGLMLAPAMVLAIWLTTSDWRRAILRIMVLTFAVVLTILPWTYRNYRLFHKVVLISTGGGAAFWSGAHFRLEPGASLADIGFLHMLDSLPPLQRLQLQGLPEPQQEQQFYRWGSTILAHSPQRLALMAWRNLESMYAFSLSGKYHSTRNRLLYSLSYIPVFTLGIGGFWLVRRRWRKLSMFWGWILTNTALYCLYFATVRYRVPTIDPILTLGSGVCLAAVYRRIRRDSASKA